MPRSPTPSSVSDPRAGPTCPPRISPPTARPDERAPSRKGIPMKRWLLAGPALVSMVLWLSSPASAAADVVHWTLLHPATSPSARSHAWTAFDAAHRRVVL